MPVKNKVSKDSYTESLYRRASRSSRSLYRDLSIRKNRINKNPIRLSSLNSGSQLKNKMLAAIMRNSEVNNLGDDSDFGLSDNENSVERFSGGDSGLLPSTSTNDLASMLAMSSEYISNNLASAINNAYNKHYQDDILSRNSSLEDISNNLQYLTAYTHNTQEEYNKSILKSLENTSKKNNTTIEKQDSSMSGGASALELAGRDYKTTSNRSSATGTSQFTAPSAAAASAAGGGQTQQQLLASAQAINASISNINSTVTNISNQLVGEGGYVPFMKGKLGAINYKEYMMALEGLYQTGVQDKLLEEVKDSSDDILKELSHIKSYVVWGSSNILQTFIGGLATNVVKDTAKAIGSGIASLFNKGKDNISAGQVTSKIARFSSSSFSPNLANLLDYSGSGSGLDDAGSGSDIISQLNPEFKNIKVGDKSMADNGCAPATALMALRDLGNGNSMQDAANTANKYQTSGGTDASYFKEEFAKNGVEANYTKNTNDIRRSIESGTPTVLLGQDTHNDSKANSPFGPKNHYVVAKGMTDNGQVVVQDPESNRETVYNSNILKNVKLGIGAGKSNISKKKLVSTKSVYNSGGDSGAQEIINYYNDQAASDKAAQEKKARQDLGDKLTDQAEGQQKALEKSQDHIQDMKTAANGTEALTATIDNNNPANFTNDAPEGRSGPGGVIDYFTPQQDTSTVTATTNTVSTAPVTSNYTFPNVQSKDGETTYGEHLSDENKSWIIDLYRKNGFSDTDINYLLRTPVTPGYLATSGLPSTNDIESYKKGGFQPLLAWSFTKTKLSSYINNIKKNSVGVPPAIEESAFTTPDNNGLSVGDLKETDYNQLNSVSLGDLKQQDYSQLQNNNLSIGDLKQQDYAQIQDNKKTSVDNMWDRNSSGTTKNTTTKDKESNNESKYDGIMVTEDSDPETIKKGIWDYLTSDMKLSENAAAGIMGNWQKESGNTPNIIEGVFGNNAQQRAKEILAGGPDSLSNYAETSLFPQYAKQGTKISKTGYLVNGKYFPGIGLAQWTGPRAQSLLDYAQSEGSSWGSLKSQLGFFTKEFNQKSALQEELSNAQSPEDAAAIFFDRFEANYSNAHSSNPMYPGRPGYARDMYNKFSGTADTTTVGLTGTNNGSVSSGTSSVDNNDYSNTGSGESSNEEEISTATGEEEEAPKKEYSGISGFTGFFSDLFDVVFGRKTLDDVLGKNQTETSNTGSEESSEENGQSSSTSTSSDNSEYNPRYMAGEKDPVGWMESIKGQIAYAQDGPRNPDKGSADCSSTVEWAIKKAGGPDIGGWTGSQYNSPELYDIANAHGAILNTLPEDIKRNDVMFFVRDYAKQKGLPNGIGHVGLYMGNGKYIDHGSGMGPKEKTFSSGSQLTQVSRLKNYSWDKEENKKNQEKRKTSVDSMWDRASAGTSKNTSTKTEAVDNAWERGSGATNTPSTTNTAKEEVTKAATENTEPTTETSTSTTADTTTQNTTTEPTTPEQDPEYKYAHDEEVNTEESTETSGGASGLPQDTIQRDPVDWMESVLGQLQYGWDIRNPDKGSADCSSTVNWAIQKSGGPDIGSYTGAQSTSPELYDIENEHGKTIAQLPSDVKRNDILFFTRDYAMKDMATYPDGIGHVGLYMGNGKYIDHGGGPNGDTPGPVIKTFSGTGDRLTQISRLKNYSWDGADRAKSTADKMWDRNSESDASKKKKIHSTGDLIWSRDSGNITNLYTGNKRRTKHKVKQNNIKDRFAETGLRGTEVKLDNKMSGGASGAQDVLNWFTDQETSYKDAQEKKERQKLGEKLTKQAEAQQKALDESRKNIQEKSSPGLANPANLNETISAAQPNRYGKTIFDKLDEGWDYLFHKDTWREKTNADRSKLNKDFVTTVDTSSINKSDADKMWDRNSNTRKSYYLHNYDNIKKAITDKSSNKEDTGLSLGDLKKKDYAQIQENAAPSIGDLKKADYEQLNPLSIGDLKKADYDKITPITNIGDLKKKDYQQIEKSKGLTSSGKPSTVDNDKPDENTAAAAGNNVPAASFDVNTVSKDAITNSTLDNVQSNIASSNNNTVGISRETAITLSTLVTLVQQIVTNSAKLNDIYDLIDDRLPEDDNTISSKSTVDNGNNGAVNAAMSMAGGASGIKKKNNTRKNSYVDTTTKSQDQIRRALEELKKVSDQIVSF